jgi:hypothetical protein
MTTWSGDVGGTAFASGRPSLPVARCQGCVPGAVIIVRRDDFDLLKRPGLLLGRSRVGQNAFGHALAIVGRPRIGSVANAMKRCMFRV